jgi:hypothetical protein
MEKKGESEPQFTKVEPVSFWSVWDPFCVAGVLSANAIPKRCVTAVGFMVLAREVLRWGFQLSLALKLAPRSVNSSINWSREQSESKLPLCSPCYPLILSLHNNILKASPKASLPPFPAHNTCFNVLPSFHSPFLRLTNMTSGYRAFLDGLKSNSLM